LWLFFSLLIFLFLSCVTLSPVDLAPEKPLSAITPAAAIPHWRSLAADLVKGVDYFAGKSEKPRLAFWALRIDLSEAALRIVVRDGAVAHNGAALSTKVSSFVRDNDLLAGINAAPFDVSSAREREPRINVGIVVSDGVLLSPPNPRYDAIVWYAGGTAAIVPQSGLRGAENIINAVGGFHRILQDGALTKRALQSKPRYPRSAAGLSTGGRFLYLLVIDGGQSGSAGATEAETALLLRALGAQDGLNLDGGGSSALAVRYPDGKTRVVNTPVHNGIPGRERAVAACLGVAVNHPAP
jgi:hypothetical protein